MPNEKDNKSLTSLRPAQVSKLRAILGKTDAVEEYLCLMDEVISKSLIMMKNSIYKSRTPAQTREKLLAIRRHTGNLITELQPAALEDEKSYYVSDQIDFDLNFLLEGSSNNALVRLGRGGPNFLYRLVSSLQVLERSTTLALSQLPKSKRGGASPTEREHQYIEWQMIHLYRKIFGCYPARTQDGAFHQAATIFYKSARLPTGNSYRRIRKAIDRARQFDFPDGVPNPLEPKRGLHPRKK